MKIANPAGNTPLNKQVSDEVLGEPVLVPEVTAGAMAKAAAAGPAYVVLIGISFSHFLNDTMQSLIASVYPILKDAYALNFALLSLIAGTKLDWRYVVAGALLLWAQGIIATLMPAARAAAVPPVIATRTV